MHKMHYILCSLRQTLAFTFNRVTSTLKDIEYFFLSPSKNSSMPSLFFVVKYARHEIYYINHFKICISMSLNVFMCKNVYLQACFHLSEQKPCPPPPLKTTSPSSLPAALSFCLLWDFIYMGSYSICPSVTALFHLASCLQGSSL